MRDFSEQIARVESRLRDAKTYLRVDELRDRRPQLETEMSRPDLWDDADMARKVQTELSAITDDLEIYDGLETKVDDIRTLLELGKEETDSAQISELDGEVESELAEVATSLDSLELRSLFTGEYDELDAVCQLKSGAGGTDAQDWAEMLLRMYGRWADGNAYTVETVAVSEGGEAGITNAEFIVRGRHAYGMLQAEHGVHRLVRISPFNKEGKRQTAFASLQVVPFFEDVADEVDIDEKDLRIDTYRSSGAGGQHVNVTDSAVRITHLPTGVVTSCQNERSQHQNKDRAMQMLAAKLLDLERKKREDEMAAIAGAQANVDFGSQIRSYVLHPYQQVKDLRSEFEAGDVDTVLSGHIGPFMEAYLQWRRATANAE